MTWNQRKEVWSRCRCTEVSKSRSRIMIAFSLALISVTLLLGVRGSYGSGATTCEVATFPLELKSKGTYQHLTSILHQQPRLCGRHLGLGANFDYRENSPVLALFPEAALLTLSTRSFPTCVPNNPRSTSQANVATPHILTHLICESNKFIQLSFLR